MNNLSYLEKLLEDVEVEWKQLADIAEIYSGLTGKNKADFESGDAKYISYKNIFNNIEVDPNQLELVKVSENERQHKVRYGDILFTGSSEIAVEAGMSSAVTIDFKEPVYLNSFSFGVRFNDDVKMMPEFSKYLFRSRFMRAEIAKSASGVTRFNISKARFKKILVPIPCPNNPEKSLAIQAEIVRILDTFTELTAELTAELNMRKKQYNYYRNQLLSFKEDEVEWKTLGEIGNFIRGNGLQKKDLLTKGFPAIHYGQIYTKYGLTANETFSYISDELGKKLRKANYNDLLLATTSENDEDVVKPLAWLGNDVAISGDMMLFRHKQNVKYLAHFFLTENFQAQKRKYITGAKVRRVSSTDLAKIVVPIPYPNNPEKSLAEQARIASILDKFDTLTTSLQEGLPREIELRQKQYEYYRDLLLNFPKPDPDKAD
ncbi:restriction endonuclease subunit S [Mergibacter septicus]|uniref:Restriction endonuclease subunit S n=1 Tax=Mergibacter septicus TaxID=221402 RepID=A0A8D4IZH5_9PAST|nr:restriction endonuclease subunit S [Mergibacter septicus]AWX14912.1 restriction endonuclease subunit S [Mergibacter septicus]QDJ14164.1 restriction endonuclease subunit S [Mergibacter septicus]UTU48388.1 restriction endonuclease subunit S [Mergibacter septicus]WMR95985.1 restriction endonuclease subunit S [Mergibacter septicus]